MQTMNVPVTGTGPGSRGDPTQGLHPALPHAVGGGHAILSPFGRLGRRKVAPLAANGACEALAAAIRIVEAQSQGEANLVRMGDKAVLLSEDGKAFVMYARRGRSLIALFDPVGRRESWGPLLDRFLALAQETGCRPVFYQVSPAFLDHCPAIGLKALKLGEQAILDLSGFDLKGGKWAKLRRNTNRAERDGLQFGIVAPQDVPALLGDLESVSREWLEHGRTREKAFSLGAFDPAYLASQPVAVMRFEGRLVAFASLLATSRRESAFIDLMRFRPGIHRGLMDLLFVKIIEHLKGQGFARLDLGMAPLAGLGEAVETPVWNRLGNAVFERGEAFYNFKGLLAFKSKFDPRWEPRYLAVPRHANPYLAVLDVAILIGGGLRGVLGK